MSEQIGHAGPGQGGRAGRIGGLRMAPATALVVLAWESSIAGGWTFHPGGVIRELAVGCHLLFLFLGLGTVVVLDVLAVIALFGGGDAVRVARLAARLQPLIWLGLGGLLLSGALLSPSLGSRLTQLKLLAVLLIGLNGLRLHRLAAGLAALPGPMTVRRLPAGLRARLIGTASISQLCWWTAVTIGYVNAHH